MAKFVSNESLHKNLDSILRLSSLELDSWESDKGFISFRTYFENAQREWENIENPSDTILFLNKNKAIIESKGRYLYPTIENRVYQILSNKHGCFLIGNTLNRVIGTKVYAIEISKAYKLENPEANLKELLYIDYVSDSGFLSEGETKKTAKKAADCGLIVEEEYWHNPSGCSNDKTVRITFTYTRVTTFDELLLPGDIIYSRTFKTDGVFAYAYANKRNWLCNWKPENVNFQWRNISITANAPQRISSESICFANGALPPNCYISKTTSSLTPTTITLPNGSSGSGYSTLAIYENWPVGSFTVNEVLPLVPPASVHIEVKTSTIPNYAVLDCN